MYKKFVSLLFLFVFMFDVYADCQPTEKMLSQRSGPGHNEYLYKNTRDREKRQAGRKGKAYICGYETTHDGCSVGTKFRLSNAAVGSGGQQSDAVFVCSGGADNYYWRTVVVESECNFSVPVDSEYDSSLKLYKVGERYCEKVSDVQTAIFLDKAQGFLDVLQRNLQPENIQLDINLAGYAAQGGISGNDLFRAIKVKIESQQFTEEQKDFITEQIQAAAEETDVDIEDLETQIGNLNWKLVRVQAQVLLNNILNQANQKNITALQSQLESLQGQVNNNMTENEVLDLIIDKLDTRTFNAQELETIKTMLAEVAREYGFMNERLQYQINGLTGRVNALESDVGQVKTDLVKLKQGFMNLRSLTGQQTQEIQNLFEELQNVTSTEEFKNKVQELINSSYATDDFKKAVVEIIKNNEDMRNMQIDLSMVKDTLYEHGEMIDYLDRVTDELQKNGAKQYSEIWTELIKVRGSITSEEDLILTMEYLISVSDLNDGQKSQVVQEINKVLNGMDFVSGSAFDSLRDRVLDIEINRGFTEAEIARLHEMIGDLKKNVSVIEGNLDNVTGVVNRAMELIDDNSTAIEEVFEEIKKLPNNILTSKDFVDAVENIVSQQNLTEEQIKEVQTIINRTISDLGLVNDVQWKDVQKRLQDLEIRVGLVERRLYGVEANVNGMLSDISAIQGLNAEQQAAIERLQKDVGNYQTPQAVYQWIMDNYNIFNADQLKKIEEIAEKYIDAKLASFNARMNLMDLQRESERKILSAMSLLNAFDAATKESVWKDKDGKFNTARLASDTAAGVILGTAGGLISNKLIKKSQVKKGFENIGCYVAGQEVAAYGDEFTVGMN